MKPALQLNLSQSLNLTPQLQQAIRLLQLSTLDLRAEIQETLDSNTMLERCDENNRDEGSDLLGRTQQEKEQNTAEFQQSSQWGDVIGCSNGSGNYLSESNTASVESLHDYLSWQLNLSPFSERDRQIADVLVDAINEDGFLTVDIPDLASSFDKDMDVKRDEIEMVLHRVQMFDPIGVGARNLAECLMLQLSQLSPNILGLAEAKLIVSQYIHLLAKHDYKKLMRVCDLKESELQQALKIIHSLNPCPGSSISKEQVEYIVPDMFVRKANNHWLVELNDQLLPNLRINADYAAMIRRADNSSDNQFLRHHLQEAKFFLKSLQSRNDTLMKVANCIMCHQQDFLDFGEVAMRPLVLNDIAKEIGMHESTISRVTTRKYIHTPRGVFELKFFFSSHLSTAAGGECSSTAIRALLKKLIEAEDTRKPLSDNKLATILAEQGIKVARRTITKYREALSIPSSTQRRFQM